MKDEKKIFFADEQFLKVSLAKISAFLSSWDTAAHLKPSRYEPDVPKRVFVEAQFFQ